MKVLIASYHLGGLTGSETFWYTVADHLIRRGADVYCAAVRYGQYFGEVLNLGVKAVKRIGMSASERPDVALVSERTMGERVHGVIADVPMFYFCHGVLPEMERPPEGFLAEGYFAVSEETAEFVHEAVGCKWGDIEWPFQPVDSTRFSPELWGRATAYDVLVVSNRMDMDVERIVRRACAMAGYRVRFVGERFGALVQGELARVMAGSAIVQTLGRGAIEAMMCGAVPFIFDYRGGDGFVTPETFEEIARCNFSGRARGVVFTPGSLVKLWDLYRAEWGPKLRNRAVERYDAELLVSRLWDRMREVV